MRKTGMRRALLGGLAGAALLAGCNAYDGPFKDNPYDSGRLWSLTAQEDYYPEQARGTGGAGEAEASAGESAGESGLPRIQGSEQAQEHLWLQQDMRVPYPPPRFAAQVAVELGTGKPLRVGPNGAWIEGTRGVELGSGRAGARQGAAR